VLYARLRDAKIERYSVANAGIGGDRLLHDGSWPPFGTAALARFDRDVLAQPNVKAVILLIGINDIGQVGAGAPAEEQVSAEDLERGLAQLAERAHERGIRVYAATLTPFKPTAFKGYYSDEKDVVRRAVNGWIRQAKVFDGVADFDKALEDPSAPGQLRPAFDSVDHLHPSAAGDKAMAEAIPLDWFR
jgi:lysophospholipase L1-like esterase